MEYLRIEEALASKISEIATSEDPAHDLLHFKRVVRIAKTLCAEENGNLDIVVPAAWLHDFVIIPKNDPRRKQASQLSAEGAIRFLTELEYPEKYFNDIAHAIAGHSYSANLPVTTLEAKIVQDADRLDGLGAIGIARLFAVAGQLKTAFYSEQDPFCEVRCFDDRSFAIDHFFAKLFKVAESLKTEAGRREGFNRFEVMKRFLKDLAGEIQ